MHAHLHLSPFSPLRHRFPVSDFHCSMGRAELNHSVIEFVAPTEYMVRPPQPAVYVFLIDVSHAAVQSGVAFRFFLAAHCLIVA
jgi:hypothetical protein